jgi:competence protein ComEA
MLGGMTQSRFLRSTAQLVALVVLSLAMAAGASAALPRNVDLNLANQAELEMVKGIGPQLSERILAERANGRFENWADFIARMKGIGPSHASRLSAAGLRIAGQRYVAATLDQAGSGAAAGPPPK